MFSFYEKCVVCVWCGDDGDDDDDDDDVRRAHVVGWQKRKGVEKGFVENVESDDDDDDDDDDVHDADESRRHRHPRNENGMILYCRYLQSPRKCAGEGEEG